MTARLPRRRRFLRAQDGFDQAELLTRRNPAAILADDELLAACRRSRIRQTWMQRLKHFLEGGRVSARPIEAGLDALAARPRPRRR